jgi:hypothetical protein
MRCRLPYLAALTGVLVTLPTTGSAQTTPSAQVQIAQAVAAAPAMERADATVFGFSADGSMTTLRQGSNGLICLADDPNRDG